MFQVISSYLCKHLTFQVNTKLKKSKKIFSSSREQSITHNHFFMKFYSFSINSEYILF